MNNIFEILGLRPTIKNRLTAGGVTLLIALLAVLLISFFAFQSLQGGFALITSDAESGYKSAETSAQNLDKSATKLNAISSDINDLAFQIERTNQNVKILEKKVTAFAISQRQALRQLEAVAANMPEGEDLYLIEDVTSDMSNMEATIRREGLVSLSNTVGEMDNFITELNNKINLLNTAVEDIDAAKTLGSQVAQSNKNIQQQAQSFAIDISNSQTTIALVILITMLLLGVGIYFLIRSIVNPLATAVKSANQIAEGNLEFQIDAEGNDELTDLMNSMTTVKETLQQVILVDIHALVENAKQGQLDSNIDTTDKNGCYAELCQGINDVVNMSSSIINDTSKVISALSNGRFDQPIEREYKGSFAKLKNDANAIRTQLQQVIQSDVQFMVTEANKGNLNHRIDTQEMQGFYADLCSGINDLIQINNNIIQETSTVVSAMAKGDLAQRVKMDYQGEFHKLKQDINNTAQKLSDVIEGDVQKLVNDAKQGNLSSRIDSSEQVGFFFTLTDSVNQLVNVAESVLMDVGSTLESLAKGDLSNQIENEYQGAFDKIKQDANDTVVKLKTVIEGDIQFIVDLAKDGNLSERINEEGQTGFYLSLSKGINDLVSTSKQIVADTGTVFQQLSEGNLNTSINSEYKGEFKQLKDNANTTIDKLTKVIEGDIEGLVNQAKAGDLSNRINLEGKSGFFETLSASINELVDINEQIINDTAKVAKAMTQGDLSRRVPNHYQGTFGDLANDINVSVSNLRATISEIRESANNVNNSSEEIAQGNADLNDRTQTQAASLEEAAATMKELRDKVASTAGQSANSAKLANSARMVAAEGQEVVNKAIAAMAEIDQSSRKISDIIGVIDEIAFQTNLLALNASVEAARAGESGRGFTVVAGEVRNLAQRSAQAAKEITSLIFESGSRVDEGATLVNKTGATFSQIQEAIDSVTQSIDTIKKDATEQQSSIEQMFIAVDEMNMVTQQNSALVVESTSAAESLNEQSEQMYEMVGRFKVS